MIDTILAKITFLGWVVPNAFNFLWDLLTPEINKTWFKLSESNFKINQKSVATFRKTQLNSIETDLKLICRTIVDLEIQINNSLCHQMNRLHLYTTVKTPVSKGYFSIKQYSPYLKEGQRFGVRSGCGCGEERLRMVTAASLSWRFASVCAHAPDVVSKGFIQGCKGVRQTFTNSFNGRITWRKNIRLP